jgi:long-chain fatty acid transport protein
MFLSLRFRKGLLIRFEAGRKERSMVTSREKLAARHLALTVIALGIGALSAGQGIAGGLTAYEVGTADVGLASAGYNARAQDASTVFTNPAGMTRLEGNQFLGSGQVDYGWTTFSISPGTSPALGTDDGGNAFGSDGWFLGGGLFFSHSLSPDLKVGFAFTGNTGGVVDYGDSWVGRYYVQQSTLVGLSLLPAIAYKVTDKLSLGASMNAMYGMYKNQVAINNIVGPDGQLKLDDNTWGFGFNLGALYEFTPGLRVGVTYNSQIDLDFDAPFEFSTLSPGLRTLLASRGLLNATLDLGIDIPQQVMGSVFFQLDDRWALLGSVGWQQWSQFGQIQLGISDTTNPTSLTTNIPFEDTWHGAVGAQYRISEPWLLNFGVAYDSGYQSSSSNVSPLLPSNAAWRFGVGAEYRMSKTILTGVAVEYLYGGTLDTNITGSKPVALGGRGDLVGSYNTTGVLFIAAYLNYTF